MRTLLLIVALTCVTAGVTVGVYIVRTCREAQALFPSGYTPDARSYSSAFTDALWAQVEHDGPVVIDTNVSIASLLVAATTHRSRARPGFLFATVAAHARALAEPADEAGSTFGEVLREVVRADTLMKRYDPDTIAAIYADTTSFGGALVGLDDAARELFGKPAALLDAIEAATLVVLSWTTNRCDLARLRERRNALLGSMKAMGLTAPSEPLPSTLELPALAVSAMCATGWQSAAGPRVVQ